MAKIGVFGAGTWGVALTRMLAKSGHEVQLWSAIKSELDALRDKGEQPNLPGVDIPENISYTEDLETICQGKDILLNVVSSPYVRSTFEKAAPYIRKNQLIVNASKGIEPDSLLTLTEVIGEAVGKPVKLAALAGPTHAEEVARDLPTTIVATSQAPGAAEFVQQVFSNPVMRVYTNDDILGTELCGALKNVIALAAGISDGLGYGDNAKAGIITRGLTEMRRLGEAMGAQAETFWGLAGVGDLIVTATSRHSRNNRCGHMIGEGLSVEEAVKQVGQVVEGLNALPAALKLADKYRVDMPITRSLGAIVQQGISPGEAVKALMERDKKREDLD